MIIDAKDLILGRLATKVAKLALLGEKIDIVNCEKVIISGKHEVVMKKYKKFFDMGKPTKGPFLSRMPDRFVRKVIKRMLPYKKERGKLAFKNIMCYIGVPSEFKDQEKLTFDDITFKKLPNMYFTSVGNVCKELGCKVKFD